jgi:preprotein translocase subunit YajC
LFVAAFLPIIGVFALMWFLLIRPQQQRVRRHQAVVASLAVGDEVVTVGGICGRIVALDDELASVEVAPGVTLRVLRGAVNGRVPTETAEHEGPAPDDGETEA